MGTWPLADAQCVPVLYSLISGPPNSASETSWGNDPGPCLDGFSGLLTRVRSWPASPDPDPEAAGPLVAESQAASTQLWLADRVWAPCWSLPGTLAPARLSMDAGRVRGSLAGFLSSKEGH